MTELPSLRETVDSHGLMAKKALGQNFLLDQNVTDKIIRSSLAARGIPDFSGEDVFEIGPGPGGLTRAVLKTNPHSLTVIEMDERCIEIMQELQTVCGATLQIVNGDALEFDFGLKTERPKSIVSNLPYHISVPLLLGFLRQMRNFNSLTLMFQKEVAERISAEPNNKNYGRLSVISQLVCKVKPLFNLNPNCFVPAPKIWSSVLLFLPQENIPTAEEFKKLEKITEAAFGQRRKMIRQSLKILPNLEKACEIAGVSLTDRAENITPNQYLILAQNI
mgnify:FL=1